MEKELNTYDWHQAFKVCGEPSGTSNVAEFNMMPCPPTNKKVSLEPFVREDVKIIYYRTEDASDGWSGKLAGKLRDKRFFYLEAGCDYTGWD